MWLAGGGIRQGYAHGRTDDIHYESVINVVCMCGRYATLLHALGLNHRQLTFDHKGR
jgi:hypothetical protein